MKFNIDDYKKGRYAMHCKTEEEAKDFCNFLDSIGRHWKSGRSYAEETKYNEYKNKTCYAFNRNQYGYMNYFAEKDYTILEWNDFMNKEFTKADLKSGDVILRRNGTVGIVCLETNTLILPNGWSDLKEINKDLTFDVYNEEFDIIAVRRPTEQYDCQFRAFDFNCGNLIYERKKTEDAEEMTLEEVCKALGREIKIVKSK